MLSTQKDDTFRFDIYNDDELTLSEIMNQLFIPTLLALGYSQEQIDAYFRPES